MKTCGECKNRLKLDDGSGFDFCRKKNGKTGVEGIGYVSPWDDAGKCLDFVQIEDTK